jgi:hypothetical protein
VLSDALPKGFKRNVQSNLISVTKTVCDRLRRRENIYGDALDPVLLNAIRQRFAGEAHDAKRRVFEPRKTGFFSNGKPYLKG